MLLIEEHRLNNMLFSSMKSSRQIRLDIGNLILSTNEVNQVNLINSLFVMMPCVNGKKAEHRLPNLLFRFLRK